MLDSFRLGAERRCQLQGGIMRKRILTTAVFISLLFPATAVSGKGYGEELVMPWRFYRRLAKCETALTVNHQTRNYTSMYGIYIPTWRRWSNSSSAKGKTPLEQARVVDNIAWLGHTNPDGSFKWPVGPWGWAVIRTNCMGLQGFICRSTHPKVQHWKRGC